MTESLTEEGVKPHVSCLNVPGHAKLDGYFQHHSGPGGKVPVQLIGTLKSGEFVYFRARGLKITLEIAASEADWSADRLLASYSKQVEEDPDEPFGVGVMEPDDCVCVIAPWLDQYVGSK